MPEFGCEVVTTAVLRIENNQSLCNILDQPKAIVMTLHMCLVNLFCTAPHSNNYATMSIIPFVAQNQNDKYRNNYEFLEH